jgi:prepilin peptidase CpaA
MTDPDILHSIIVFTAATALLFAAARDLAVRTVPNISSLIIAISGLALHALDGRLIASLFNGGLVFAGAWYCWRRNWIGGGDVKLLSASALLVQPASVPELLLGTALAGGLLALFYMALARLLPACAMPRPARLLPRVWRAERRRIRRGLALPYCCAIAAGVLLTLLTPAIVS